MKRENRELETCWGALVAGSRGNMSAAYLAAYEIDDDDVRGRLLSRVTRAAGRCPVVDDDVPPASSFVWLDGSRRARLAVPRRA